MPWIHETLISKGVKKGDFDLNDTLNIEDVYEMVELATSARREVTHLLAAMNSDNIIDIFDVDCEVDGLVVMHSAV